MGARVERAVSAHALDFVHIDRASETLQLKVVPQKRTWCPPPGVRSSNIRLGLGAVSVIGRDLCKYRALMGVRQAQVVLEDGRDHSLNWGLIVGFVCCIEFWIAVTTAVLDL